MQNTLFIMPAIALRSIGRCRVCVCVCVCGGGGGDGGGGGGGGGAFKGSTNGQCSFRD